MEDKSVGRVVKNHELFIELSDFLLQKVCFMHLTTFWSLISGLPLFYILNHTINKKRV